MGARSIPKFGDSLQERFPDIAMQWHPSLNNENLSPSNISYLSNVKIWWKCPKGHIWLARVSKRTNKKSAQCRSCDSKNSIIEGKLRELVKTSNIFINVSPNEATFQLNGFESHIDIVGYYKNRKVAIEYDGNRWHKTENRVQRDIRKTTTLLDEGLTVVRIREKPLLHLDIQHPNLVQLSYRHSLDETKLKELIYLIAQRLDQLDE